MRLGLLVLPVMVAALAGCQTGQQTVTKNPRAALARCLSRMETTDISAKYVLASFMGVSMERMPALFCQRLVDTTLSGRLSPSDINRLQTDQPTEAWKIIKGN